MIVEQGYKWIIFANNEKFFLFKNRKEAVSSMKLYNSEKESWEDKYHLFKLVK